MSVLTAPAFPPAPDTLTVDQTEAERLTGLSYKTLERATLAGEPTGRAKIGRRVVYVRAVLEKWVISKLSNQSPN